MIFIPINTLGFIDWWRNRGKNREGAPFILVPTPIVSCSCSNRTPTSVDYAVKPTETGRLLLASCSARQYFSISDKVAYLPVRT